MEEGPSILNKDDLDKSQFYELMMDTCNLRSLGNKIQGGMVKFQKSFQRKAKSFSINAPKSGVKFSDESIEDQSKSTFFITQGFPTLNLKTPNT